jgi:hypothetical protein
VIVGVVERTTEDVGAIVAATMDDRRFAGLTDNARAITAALRADDGSWRTGHKGLASRSVPFMAS